MSMARVAFRAVANARASVLVSGLRQSFTGATRLPSENESSSLAEGEGSGPAQRSTEPAQPDAGMTDVGRRDF